MRSLTTPTRAHDSFRLRVALPALAVFLAPGSLFLHAQPTDQPTVQPSVSEILAAVEQARAGIISLKVSVTQTITDQMYDHATTAVAPNKFWYERTYTANGGDQGKQHFHAGSYCGTKTVRYFSRNNVAAFDTNPDITEFDGFNTSGGGFFDLMLWYPCKIMKGTIGPSGGLGETLSMGPAVVRPGTEVVNGFECVVVDVMANDDGGIRTTLWLDPAKEYLPIRHRMLSGTTPNTIRAEYEIDAAIERAGHWFPLSGSRWSAALPPGEFPEFAAWHADSLTIMSVDMDQDGEPALEVNTELDNAMFDYLNSVPANATIADMQTGQFWMAANTNYDQSARVALASIQPARSPIDEVRSFAATNANDSERSRLTVPWIGTLVIGIGFGLLLTRRATH